MRKRSARPMIGSDSQRRSSEAWPTCQPPRFGTHIYFHQNILKKFTHFFSFRDWDRFKRENACLKLQAAWRGHLVRRDLSSLREAAATVAAVRLIQHGVRRWLNRAKQRARDAATRAKPLQPGPWRQAGQAVHSRSVERTEHLVAIIRMWRRERGAVADPGPRVIRELAKKVHDRVAKHAAADGLESAKARQRARLLEEIEELRANLERHGEDNLAALSWTVMADFPIATERAAVAREALRELERKEATQKWWVLGSEDIIGLEDAHIDRMADIRYRSAVAAPNDFENVND